MKLPETTFCRSWPEPRQDLLLQAALARNQSAIACWENFLTEFDLDHLDEGEFRLLPLIWRNLSRHGYQGETLAQLKSAHRQSWHKNQMLTHRLCEVLSGLEQRGIPALLLKGLPLAHLYYEDLGLRPMRDLDMLVPEAELDRTIDHLTQTGWEQTSPEEIRGSLRRYRRFGIEVAFRNVHGEELDLHYHIAHWASSAEIDELLWRSAVPLVLQGIETRTLAPTHHLLHACVHGAAWNAVPPMRWVADAVMLARGGAIDWKWLDGFARRQQLVLPLLAAFTYLSERFEISVPSDLFDQWRSVEFSLSDLAEFDHQTRPAAPQSLPDVIRVAYRHHTRACAGRSRIYKWASFPIFVAYFFEVIDRRKATARRALTWIVNRMRGSAAAEQRTSVDAAESVHSR